MESVFRLIPTIFRFGVIAAVVLLWVAGCTTVPGPVKGPVDLPDAFSESGSSAQQSQWWRSFNDPALDSAIEQALTSNFSLRSVWDRLAQAEAIAKREGSGLYPSVDVEAGTSGSRSKRNGRKTDTTNLLLGLAAGYEVDLWGRIRSAREAALLDVQAGEQEIQAAAVSLSAAVAETWYRLAEALEQVRIVASQKKTNEQLFELVLERFRQGQVQAVDVLQQGQLVQSGEGALTLAGQRVQSLRHQLAVLLGSPPKSKPVSAEPSLIPLGPLPDTGVPSELMQRRPDVRKAYLEVRAQDRRLASAIAAQYPRLSLSAGVETGGSNVRDLFDNWLGTLAANLIHPLFDGGERKAEADRYRAVLSEAYHNYGQTVLDALQEVEDALSNLAYQEDYLKSLEEQLKIAATVIERTRSSYLNGQLDYLRVLQAVTSKQSLEREHLTSQRERIEYRIQLHRALAGPIALDRPPQARRELVFENKDDKPEIVSDE